MRNQFTLPSSVRGIMLAPPVASAANTPAAAGGSGAAAASPSVCALLSSLPVPSSPRVVLLIRPATPPAAAFSLVVRRHRAVPVFLKCGFMHRAQRFYSAAVLQSREKCVEGEKSFTERRSRYIPQSASRRRPAPRRCGASSGRRRPRSGARRLPSGRAPPACIPPYPWGNCRCGSRSP
jgi:hypothetical protein